MLTNMKYFTEQSQRTNAPPERRVTRRLGHVCHLHFLLQMGSRSLEVLRPNFPLDVCREFCFDCIWKRYVENLCPNLGCSLRVGCIHKFYAGV
jgi:hypothetical protein